MRKIAKRVFEAKMLKNTEDFQAIRVQKKLFWDQRVVGSNPITPIFSKQR